MSEMKLERTKVYVDEVSPRTLAVTMLESGSLLKAGKLAAECGFDLHTASNSFIKPLMATFDTVWEWSDFGDENKVNIDVFSMAVWALEALITNVMMESAREKVLDNLPPF